MATRADSEAAIREYLLYLENPSQLVDEGELEALRRAASDATDPIDRLKALARLESAQRPVEATYREAFINHAKSWAEANGVGSSAFTSMGVPTAVLRAAGLTAGPPRSNGGRSGGNQPRRHGVAVDTIKSVITRWSGPFTLADVAEEAGGSPMTVRKAVTDLVEAGTIRRVGPSTDWPGPGRAPIVFERA